VLRYACISLLVSLCRYLIISRSFIVLFRLNQNNGPLPVKQYRLECIWSYCFVTAVRFLCYFPACLCSSRTNCRVLFIVQQNQPHSVQNIAIRNCVIISACFEYWTNISSNIVNIHSISRSSLSCSAYRYLKRNPYMAFDVQNAFLLAAVSCCPSASPYTHRSHVHIIFANSYDRPTIIIFSEAGCCCVEFEWS
jgi:hypothetical protein